MTNVRPGHPIKRVNNIYFNAAILFDCQFTLDKLHKAANKNGFTIICSYFVDCFVIFLK